MSYLFSSEETQYLSSAEVTTKNSAALTTFDNLKEGMIFPPTNVQRRYRVHRFNRKLYDGSAYENFYMTVRVNNEIHKTPYTVIPLNYFALIVNKLDALLFNQQLQVKTGDVDKDAEVEALIAKTGYYDKIRLAIRLANIYGDSVIKVSKCEDAGSDISVLTPVHAYKVVSPHDKSIKGTVLFELLSTEEDKYSEVVGRVEFIRILVVGKNYEYERVFRYSGGKLGESVDYWYKGRKIKKEGNRISTNIDSSTCIWVSCNQDGDVYGESAFGGASIKGLIFSIQNRLSCDSFTLDAHTKPYLMVGLSSLRQDSETGGYYLKTINDKYLVTHEGDISPTYLTWDGHLTESASIRDFLLDAFYSITEISKSLVTGEFKGNVSEETFQNTIQSSIDRAMREVSSFRASCIDVLYVLCRLNGVDIKREDINLIWQVGRADAESVITDVMVALSNNEILSKKSLLTKYLGYKDSDVDAEFEQLERERSIFNKDVNVKEG